MVNKARLKAQHLPSNCLNNLRLLQKHRGSQKDFPAFNQITSLGCLISKGALGTPGFHCSQTVLGEGIYGRAIKAQSICL